MSGFTTEINQTQHEIRHHDQEQQTMKTKAQINRYRLQVPNFNILKKKICAGLREYKE